jgi:hypothetical protein
MVSIRKSGVYSDRVVIDILRNLSRILGNITYVIVRNRLTCLSIRQLVKFPGLRINFIPNKLNGLHTIAE